MKKYMLIFRNDKVSHQDLNEEQMKSVMNDWKKWISDIGKSGKFESTNRLLPEGRTVKPNNTVTDGPYAEIKEFIGGYLIVRASSLNEAVEIAKGCPTYKRGGNVEVRTVMDIDSDYKSATFLEEKVLHTN